MAHNHIEDKPEELDTMGAPDSINWVTKGSVNAVKN